VHDNLFWQAQSISQAYQAGLLFEQAVRDEEPGWTAASSDRREFDQVVTVERVPERRNDGRWLYAAVTDGFHPAECETSVGLDVLVTISIGGPNSGLKASQCSTQVRQRS